MTCDFCTVDREKSEAYVKFRERGDVLRLWDGGDLDGGNNRNTNGYDGGLSLSKAGVRVKAIHWTNQVPWIPEGDKTHQFERSEEHDGQHPPFGRKRSWDGREGGRGTNNGGRGDAYSVRGRGEQGRGDFNKMPRRDYYSTPSSDNNVQQDPLHSSASHEHQSSTSHLSREHHSTSTSSYDRAPPPNSQSKKYIHSSTPNNSEPTPTKPIQIHSQTSPTTTSWHRNPPSQHHANTTTQTLSTLEQKLSLLQQQEAALQKQLTLQKKMLSVLKSKESSKDDQTQQLKEILSTQTKIMELKKERMTGMRELEGLKDNITNNTSGRRTGLGGRKKLDLRSRILKVNGLDCAMNEVRNPVLYLMLLYKMN
jgi:hypothetical protein